MRTLGRVTGPALLAAALFFASVGGAHASGGAGDVTLRGDSVDAAAPGETTWSKVFTIEPGPYSRLTGVAEARGTLFALGRSGRTQPAIWISRNGTDWAAATVPAVTEHIGDADDGSGDLTAFVVDVVDAGPRLVALAVSGLAEGSGPIGTKIYVSADEGQTWTESPAAIAGTMFDLVRAGDRLIAVGTAIWTSDDDGTSWIEALGSASVGGALHAVDARAGTIVAVGDSGNGDLTDAPALALVSTDGLTWQRIVIDPEAMAYSVAIGTSARVVAMGGDTAGGGAHWYSDDHGQTWSARRQSIECCASDVVATPNGWVAASSTSFDGALTSSDGVTWQRTTIRGGLDDVAWGPSFGVSAVSGDSILLARATGAAGGSITFRLVLRGTVREGDSFTLAVNDLGPAGLIISPGVRCGPDANVVSGPFVPCAPGTYDFVLPAMDELPVGNPLKYVFVRNHGPETDRQSDTIYQDTITITENAQVFTVVYDYDLGASLPDTAMSVPSRGVPLGIVALICSLLAAVAYARRGRVRRAWQAGARYWR